MSFDFHVASRPFPRWWGPFSPSRGKRTGMRVRDGRIGTWVEDDGDCAWWPVHDSAGSRQLIKLVSGTWGGGRILMLPSGHIIKPLQEADEVGIRVLIGRFVGSIVFDIPMGGVFDMDTAAKGAPGDLWSGPKSIGLECVLRSDGAIHCGWHHPTADGTETTTEQLIPASGSRHRAFRLARPTDTVGRVHLAGNGAITTNQQDRSGRWISRFVGKIESQDWSSWDHWIGDQS